MVVTDGKTWKEIRCTNPTCRKLLGLENIFSGRLQIKCSKCHTLTEVDYRTPKKLLEKLNDDKIDEVLNIIKKRR